MENKEIILSLEKHLENKLKAPFNKDFSFNILSFFVTINGFERIIITRIKNVVITRGLCKDSGNYLKSERKKLGEPVIIIEIEVDIALKSFDKTVVSIVAILDDNKNPVMDIRVNLISNKNEIGAGFFLNMNQIVFR
ncbi:MAG: hypothetical protein WCO35_01850 [Candidatus Nomurabacteria bacterium]